MFSPEERARIRDALLARAREDERIVGAAFTGSFARDAEDRWSDIDLFFGVAAGTDVSSVAESWSEAMYRDHGAIHHFEVGAGAAIYRAFLLPDCLEVDLGFAPAKHFGARSPSFALVFGEPVDRPHEPPPDADGIIGLAWHHVRHARMSIERGKAWQAEYWIGELRHHALMLACLRHALPARYARGIDDLPPEVTRPFEDAFARSLERDELCRALAVATRRFMDEVAHVDATLADRLWPPLSELAEP